MKRRDPQAVETTPEATEVEPRFHGLDAPRRVSRRGRGQPSETVEGLEELLSPSEWTAH